MLKKLTVILGMCIFAMQIPAYCADNDTKVAQSGGGNFIDRIFNTDRNNYDYNYNYNRNNNNNYNRHQNQRYNRRNYGYQQRDNYNDNNRYRDRYRYNN